MASPKVSTDEERKQKEIGSKRKNRSKPDGFALVLLNQRASWSLSSISFFFFYFVNIIYFCAHRTHKRPPFSGREATKNGAASARDGVCNSVAKNDISSRFKCPFCFIQFSQLPLLLIICSKTKYLAVHI